MLEVLRCLIGRDDKDTILNYLIAQAQAEFMAYCHRTNVPEAADEVIIQMVLTKYNRLGAEGLSSESVSGSNSSYVDGYSANVLAAMNHFRKLKLL